MRLHALASLVAAALFLFPAGAAPKDDLLAADKAFCDMSIAKGSHAAFLAYMTDDVRLYDGTHPPLLGKKAVEAYYAGVEKSDPTYSNGRLEWTPLEAEASPDGMLGWTRGTWIWTLKKPDGTSANATGYYVTGWRKQPDGSWKFDFDIGGTDRH
jgi:ketosteroid isomerase-like protein